MVLCHLPSSVFSFKEAMQYDFAPLVLHEVLLNKVDTKFFTAVYAFE
jgi:hypothetical protein